MVDAQTGGNGRPADNRSLPEGSAPNGSLPGGGGSGVGAGAGDQASLPQGGGLGNQGAGTPGGGTSTPPGLEGLIAQTGDQKFFLLPPGYGGSIQQKINVPAWPNVAQIAQWLIQLGKNLVAVSPHSDMAEMEWIKECKYKTFEELADSGEKRFFKWTSN